LELAQRDALLLLVAGDRVRLARQLGLELLGRAQEVEPVGIELGRTIGLERAQLFALLVVGQDREPRLCRAQRQLLAAIGHPSGEDRVLDRVVPLGELGEEETALAGLAEPVEPLALVALRALLGVAEDVELVAAEEIGVARDERSLLRDLLLADPHSPSLLGPLEEVAPQLRLVLGGAPDSRGAHLTGGLYTRAEPASRATVP